MQYLVSKKGSKRRSHLWRAGDTACRMASTGGLNPSNYEVVDKLPPDKAMICAICHAPAPDAIPEGTAHHRGRYPTVKQLAFAKTMVEALDGDVDDLWERASLPLPPGSTWDNASDTVTVAMFIPWLKRECKRVLGHCDMYAQYRANLDQMTTPAPAAPDTQDEPNVVPFRTMAQYDADRAAPAPTA